MHKACDNKIYMHNKAKSLTQIVLYEMIGFKQSY